MEKKAGYSRKCPMCQEIFFICRPCYRGQRYCSKHCSLEGRKTLRRDSQRIYQQSELGREKHRLKQQAYRLRKAKRSSVTDHSQKNGKIKGKLLIFPKRRISTFAAVSPARNPRFPCRMCRDSVHWLPANGESYRTSSKQQRKRLGRRRRNIRPGMG
jgi:hypothetical protein